MENKILEQIKNSEADMLGTLEKLVNIDSGYDAIEGTAEIAHIVGDFLTPYGFEVQYLETPNAPTHVLAKRPRPGKKKVMLMGHMDTVFAKGTAAARPFKVADGKAYGPGVMDMKAGIVLSLYTVKALLDNGWDDTDLTLFFCGDEELAHPLTDAVEWFKKEGLGKDAVFNMEPGREDGSVVIGRKGVIRPVLTVRGIAAHAGNEPEKGASAVLELCHKTIALHALTDLEVGTTYNVGVFNGGSLANIVADHAEARVDIRFKTAEEAEKAIKNVEAVATKTYVDKTTTTVTENRIEFMPLETTAGVQKLYGHLAKQAEKLGLPVPGALYVGGSADSAWTAMVGAPTLCGMGPQAVGAHSNNEYLFVPSMTERARLLAMCIMHLEEMQ
ncbi:M20 family metallopeptidase [Phascolarctobacterium sp.]